MAAVISPRSIGDDPQGHDTDEQVSVHSRLLRGSDQDAEPASQRKRSTLTLQNGLALIIGLQIGSGIFSAQSLISQQVNSPAEGLGVFLMAGLLVWTGAASFVELGLLVPTNGGIQEYLRASWGDYVGYMFSWVFVGIVKPAANAVISTIFADYLLKALRPSDPIPTSMTKIVALGCVISLIFVNCLGATAGAKAANVFMMLKLAALGSIIAVGFAIFASGHGDGVPASETGWFGRHDEAPDGGSLWESFGGFSTAVFAALFCYGGWENVGFVAGDMKNPTRDLPIMIHGAMTLVIVGFFLMNASLYICLPFDVIRESKAVAVDFANRTIGAWGGVVFTIAVAISAMGAVNANMFAVAKLCVAASQRAYFPPVLADLHCSGAQDEAAYFRRVVPWPFRLPVLLFARLTRRLRWEYSVPVLALLLHGVLTASFILVGNFAGLITLLEMVKAFSYLMSVLGIFVLRRKLDNSTRPGSHPTSKAPRTWMGNPIIFASVSGLLIIRGALSAPLQGSAVLFVGILGVAVLYRRFGRRAYESSPPV
ncbi:amino acid/polyamine transporter I [Xylaria sp. CBS 124048]|nr:amino acid/polyamine transporter I [Xylaria sp. CBS 124048]